MKPVYDRPRLHEGNMATAVASLLNYRRYVMVPNVSWGLGLSHEVDVLALDQNRRFTEIEIKVTKADLKKDQSKTHGHESKFISRLVFAVPVELVEYARTVIPERAGLISVEWREHLGWKAKWVKLVRIDMKKPLPPDHMIANFYRLGCMRIWTLKESLHACQARKLKP